MSITELADSADVSESAVTKLCKQIGAQGFQQVKISLARDIVQPVQFIQEDLSVGDDVQTVNEKIFHANIQALRDTLQVVKAIEMTRARDLILAADRVEIYGRVENFTGKHYETNYEYGTLPRSGYVGVRATF